MQLIIVESPTKAKTISKFLGKGYLVESSFGHIRDLPEKKMGIDIENGFEPEYVIPKKAKPVVKKLADQAKKSAEVILASDEDREGEAIAWHLSQALDLPAENTKRIVFHEITKEAIEEAMKSPRTIDMKLVEAQQARRLLDRLVGYELSPFLWKKVARGLSAGRVQSAAIRLIVEREEEIKAFKAQKYWSLEAKFRALSQKDSELVAQLIAVAGKSFDKLSLNEIRAKEIEADLKVSQLSIKDVAKKATKKEPPAPFTTSTLQQTANRWLGFSAKQTMTVAQKLYEEGHITYMRTDSVNLSSKFTQEAKAYITTALGQEYALEKPRFFKNRSKNAQEAHEAVRPTDATLDPEQMEGKLEPGQLKLYRLIWQRSIATQMAAAEMDNSSITVEAKGKERYDFRATGQIIRFPGYLKLYPEKVSEQDLPSLDKDEAIALVSSSSIEHETKAPARYSDAGLVKEMEKYGIGRPSTYAATISTVIARNYVERADDKRLAPTPIAFVVNKVLTEHFPLIVDYKFTAQMEDDLDEVAEGKKKWVPLLDGFYSEFHRNLENKYEEIKKSDIMPEERSDEKCDKCGAPMIIKTGRFGKFLACSAFPDCKNIKSMDKKKDEELEKIQAEHADEKCDKCGADMVAKKGKFGPFLACSAFPKCRNIKNIGGNGASSEETIDCPACKKGKIVAKRSRRGIFYACNQYPACKNAYPDKPTGKMCDLCGSPMLQKKDGDEYCSNKECE